SVFFLYQYVHPPYLHSFPTRRSSDLPDSTDGHVYLAYLAALAAPLSYGVAASYGQRYLGHTSALVNSAGSLAAAALLLVGPAWLDRKSTRLNSSHVKISYAVFCLKKK